MAPSGSKRVIPAVADGSQDGPRKRNIYKIFTVFARSGEQQTAAMLGTLHHPEALFAQVNVE